MIASLTASATSGPMPTPCSSAKSTTARRTPGTAAGVACVRSSSRSISTAAALSIAQLTDTFGSSAARAASRRLADADQLQGEHRAVVDDVADLELAQRLLHGRDHLARIGRCGRAGRRAAAPRRSARPPDGVSVTPSV